MVKWTIKLGEFDLSYISRSLIKAQILADFIVECTMTIDDEIGEQFEDKISEPVWILHEDENSNAQDNRADLILTNINRMVTEYALRFAFKASNNKIEYEA